MKQVHQNNDNNMNTYQNNGHNDINRNNYNSQPVITNTNHATNENFNIMNKMVVNSSYNNENDRGTSGKKITNTKMMSNYIPDSRNSMEKSKRCNKNNQNQKDEKNSKKTINTTSDNIINKNYLPTNNNYHNRNGCKSSLANNNHLSNPTNNINNTNFFEKRKDNLTTEADENKATNILQHNILKIKDTRVDNHKLFDSKSSKKKYEESNQKKDNTNDQKI